MSGGDKLQEKLAELAKKASGTVRVGFLEGATYPDGASVATVAAIQNYGAPAAGIPPRPFFTDAIRKNRLAWGAKLGAILASTNFDGPLALKRMGELIAGDLRQSIVDTNAPPLSPDTVKRKGFTKALVDTGHMLASVDWEVEDGDDYTRGSNKPESMSQGDWDQLQQARTDGLRDRALGRG